ncbi:MAG TPA: hypothetical protein VH308_04910, partial [Terracidiphilus sp.]|nr:hypothetical protein [Terracidiphilus sp.]
FIRALPFDSRQTPFLKAHSTAVAGYHDNPRGDDRFYNNLFVQHADLSVYDNTPLPMTMKGNVFLDGAKSSGHEKDPLVLPNFDPKTKLQAKPSGLILQINFAKAWSEAGQHQLVTTALLGKASIPDLPYEQPDGAPIRIDTDYLGKARSETNPTPGPFERPGQGLLNIKVW